MGKKITKSINLDEQALVIVTSDEQQAVFPLSAYSQEILTHLALHGLSQKLGDSVARGDIVEPADVLATITGVNEKLLAGAWNAARESSGGAGRTTLLAEAIARIAGKPLDEAKEVINSLSDDQKKTLRADPNVKAAMATIRAEREAEKAKDSELDLNAMFGAGAAV